MVKFIKNVKGARGFMVAGWNCSTGFSVNSDEYKLFNKVRSSGPVTFKFSITEVLVKGCGKKQMNLVKPNGELFLFSSFSANQDPRLPLCETHDDAVKFAQQLFDTRLPKLDDDGMVTFDYQDINE